jgi:RNA polymerase sigma-70 factor (ECF subfamily)
LETSDAELVNRCRRGDREAWEVIVRLHHQRIYNLAYRFTAKFDEAEDLTQEVFLKVYRMLHAYHPESGALATWVVRVARNHFIDHYRKFRTERTHTESLDQDFERSTQNPARYPNPAEGLESRERSEEIHAALLKLSPDLREAVVLRDLEEMTYEEVAEVLSIPVGTVKSRINRGRVELARILTIRQRRQGL